jgi:hypothetical protein
MLGFSMANSPPPLPPIAVLSSIAERIAEAIGGTVQEPADGTVPIMPGNTMATEKVTVGAYGGNGLVELTIRPTHTGTETRRLVAFPDEFTEEAVGIVRFMVCNPGSLPAKVWETGKGCDVRHYSPNAWRVR